MSPTPKLHLEIAFERPKNRAALQFPKAYVFVPFLQNCSTSSPDLPRPTRQCIILVMLICTSKFSQQWDLAISPPTSLCTSYRPHLVDPVLREIQVVWGDRTLIPPSCPVCSWIPPYKKKMSGKQLSKTCGLAVRWWTQVPLQNEIPQSCNYYLQAICSLFSFPSRQTVLPSYW